MKIAFIGGGNMATALISSLFATDHNIDRLQVAEPNAKARQKLEKQWPLTCFANATEAIENMDAIVLAVKPVVVPLVLKEIQDMVNSEQVVVSMVAGVNSELIADQLNSESPIVRTMPNIPALIGMGITGMYASDNCLNRQRAMAQQIMESAGEVVWLEDESLMDVVTAISGSGPAYFFYMIEALRDAGVRLGLSRDVASKLALYTAQGAGAMAVQSDMDVSELRRQVTTEGGTTAAALDLFEAADFALTIDTAVEAATQRSQELAKEGAKS